MKVKSYLIDAVNCTQATFQTLLSTEKIERINRNSINEEHKKRGISLSLLFYPQSGMLFLDCIKTCFYVIVVFSVVFERVDGF